MQLRRVFGVFVVATGVVMLYKNLGGNFQPSIGVQHLDSLIRVVEMLSVGVFVGLVSGLLGVGGGLVYVPTLVFLLGYGEKLAHATSLMVIVPVAFSGSIVHASKGNIIGRLAAPMAIGALAGVLITTHFVSRIENQSLGVTFGVFLLCVGASMIFGYGRRGREPKAAAEPPASGASQ